MERGRKREEPSKAYHKDKKHHVQTMLHSHLADGKIRCGNNFGIFPTLLISVYGKFFTTTIFHRPIKPILSTV